MVKAMPTLDTQFLVVLRISATNDNAERPISRFTHRTD